MTGHSTWESVNKLTERVKKELAGHGKLAQMFEKCYANTLNTTVKQLLDGTTYVITGDIPAMWLRDSAAQLRPYLIPAREDEKLAELIAGLVRRQFFYINIDPYANAFNETPNGACWEHDDTQMNDWLWERKYEVDSLCYPIQLAYLLWKNTGCMSQFNEDFQSGVQKILAVFCCEQKHEENSAYRFARKNAYFTDTLRMLQKTDADTNLMHEGVDVDAPEHYTREWFSWANALFCELVLKLCGYEVLK